MQYVLLVSGSRTAWQELPEDAQRQFYADHQRLMADLAESGVDVVWGCSLAQQGDVAVTAERDGTRSVAPQPFLAGTGDDHLGGMYVIDVDSRDDAVDWAKRVPLVPGGGAVHVCQPQQLICPA